MTYGISGKRVSVISYGKERPVNTASTPVAWSQNRTKFITPGRYI
jgi:peptidoglycan-associated lipoprotein